jgi:methylamine dehydrogenase light chain
MSRKWLSQLDGLAEKLTRNTARTGSRRAFLSGVGTALIGVGAVPLLPVFRSSAFGAPSASEEGDPTKCDYWRYCAVDGYLCACCGGTASTCPPGSIASAITWIGTCHNPTDSKDYIISYNDCCGTTGCGRCFCSRGEGITPIYRPQTSNDIHWCSGSQNDIPYICSLAAVIGVKN